MDRYIHTIPKTHTHEQTKEQTNKQANIHTSKQTYIHTYIHTYSEQIVGQNICQYICNMYSHVSSQRVRTTFIFIIDLLAQKHLLLQSPDKTSCAAISSRSRREHQIDFTAIHSYCQEKLIHRLSAASLQRSLRARDRGLVTEMADDSSDNAFSFAGHAAAPAAGTQSNSSQSIDTGGSENSELRTQVPRRALVAPRGRLPTIPAIEDADNTSGKRRSSERQLSSEAYILESAFTDSGRYTIGDRIIQKVSAPSPGSDLFTAYQDELTEYKISLDKATEEKSVLQVRLHEMAAYANQQFNSLERPRVKR